MIDKTLFERIFFSIRKIQNTVEHLYNIQVKIPIYIMTSEFNRNSIYSLLQSHNFYHLSESQFVLFTQGSLPCVDQHGVFILREKNQVLSGLVSDVDRSLSWWEWRLLFCNASRTSSESVEGERYPIYPFVWSGQCDGAGRNVREAWCVACRSVLFRLLPWAWKRSLHEMRGEVMSRGAALCSGAI